MSRIRRFFRRALKPAVMVAVAGTLAVSLTVTTTQKAEATPIAALPVIAAAEGIVAGASIPLAMPSLLAASIALHPVGWAIGAAVVVGGLAYGAYATKDYWLPYVTGDFGNGDNDKDAVGGNGPNDPYIMQGLRLTALTLDGTRYGSVSVKWGYQWTSSDWTTAITVNCKTSSGALSSLNQNISARNGSLETRTFPISCPTGETMVGAVAGAGASHAALSGRTNNGGPENTKTAGTYTPAGFDPNGSDVKYKTTSECISDDGTKSTITAEWLGSDGGAKMPSCAAAGKGHNTGVNKIEGYAPTAPGVPGTVPQTLWDTKAPAVDPNYAQCDQGRPGSGCKMAITIDGKPCVVGQWECENWSELFNDPATKARVGCTYGPYTLGAEMCSIMEPAYRPGGGPLTEANIDGNPQTRNNNDLSGQPFTPQTTAPGAVPGAAGAPLPGMDPSAGECFPTGWGMLNPVEWVMKPVGCALSAAFVPKAETVQAQSTRIQNKFNTVGFTTVSNAWLGTFESAGGGSGCSGPTVNFAMNGVSHSFQPFQACTQPMSTVAGVAYAVSAIMIVLFGGLGVVRAIGAALGFNFSLGKGGDTE